MGKSLHRVIKDADELGLNIELLELQEQARTAQQAADIAGCEINQILKSIIFLGSESHKCILFMTAGGNHVDADKAAKIAQEPLSKADANIIRKQTGFAIGGVSPIGLITPIPQFFDPDLLKYDYVWAAAGKPDAVFKVNPNDLLQASPAMVANFTI